MTTLWSQRGTCTSVFTVGTPRFCISKDRLYFHNDRKGLKKIDSGDNYCFEVDDMESVYSLSWSAENKFVESLALSSAETVSAFGSLQSFSTAYKLSTLGTETSQYSYGDPLVMVDTAGNPVPFLFGRLDPSSGLCNTVASPRFLVDEDVQCYTWVDSSNLRTLSASAYGGNITQGRTPTTTNIINMAAPANAATTTYVASTSALTNVVSKVDYVIYVDGDLKITSATVTLTVAGTGTASNGVFPQQFSVHFYGASVSSSLSGNPGYLDKSDLMLLAGSQVVSVLTGVSQSGDCLLGTDSTTASMVIPIKFGTNVQIKCKVPSTVDAYCASPKMLSVVDSITRVGVFGNAQTSETADWVNVVKPSSLTTTSSNFPTEVDIEILTSQMGSPNKYQRYVVGMRILYSFSSWTGVTNPTQVVNIVYKEVLPKDVEDQRKKRRRQPFYDLFYPLVPKDAYGESRVSRSWLVSGLVAATLALLFLL